MNRKERRAMQFGAWSPNREFYQPMDSAQGLEKELNEAIDEAFGGRAISIEVNVEYFLGLE